MMIARGQKVVAALVMVALAACASAPSADTEVNPAAAGGSDVINITVNHNRMDQGELTVYIEPTGGIRTVLGMINAGELKTFRYRVVGSRNLRLAASGAAGGGVTSQAITVTEGSGLNWDIALNTVRLLR